MCFLKTMEGDIKGATDAITTSMLQFQVDLSNPIKAAGESRRMINVMAAGAKEGAAEIPQISESLVQATAKLANLFFCKKPMLHKSKWQKSMADLKQV